MNLNPSQVDDYLKLIKLAFPNTHKRCCQENSNPYNQLDALVKLLRALPMESFQHLTFTPYHRLMHLLNNYYYY